MTERLSASLGRPISLAGYRIMKGRRDTPNDWHAALGIAPREPAREPSGDTDEPRDVPRQESGGRPEKPRQPTPDALLPFEPQTAHAALTMIYVMAGKGAGAAMQAPPVEQVWTDFAPHIATAYIEWAKENETVARIIGTITLGGAGGKVLMLHASLMVQTLIVTDKLKADMLIPPPMRTAEGDETSVGDAEYPGGGTNGSGAEPPPTRTKRRPAAK